MRLIERLAFNGAGVLELGAGSGLMSQRISEFFRAKNQPESYVQAVDISSDGFKASGVAFQRWDLNNLFPCESQQFDIVFSIEVLEHLHNPYQFISECQRILRPGGLLIVTTPNNLHIGSRFRYLVSGFPSLYEPPSTKIENAGRLCGHVMPIHAAYVDYGLRRAGFDQIAWHRDKKHRHSLFWFYILLPLWRFLQYKNLKHFKAYDPEVFRECEQVLNVMGSQMMMTSRSLIVSARRLSNSLSDVASKHAP